MKELRHVPKVIATTALPQVCEQNSGTLQSAYPYGHFSFPKTIFKKGKIDQSMITSPHWKGVGPSKVGSRVLQCRRGPRRPGTSHVWPNKVLQCGPEPAPGLLDLLPHSKAPHALLNGSNEESRDCGN